MYLFSCEAKLGKPLPDLVLGRRYPLIVYIDFADLFGAEHLCNLYLLNEGFTDIRIEKRKRLTEEVVERLSMNDTDIKEAFSSGYHLRLFERHWEFVLS